MVFSELLSRFARQTPICLMTRITLESVFSAERLDGIFEAAAKRQYCRELLFSTCADLLTQVTLAGRPSVHAVFKSRREEIPASVVAVYDKLKNTEPAVCEALVADTAGGVADVLGRLGVARPEPVPGYRLQIIDGNYLAGTEHRLGPLRDTGAAALPGMVVAVYDHARGLIRNVVVSEDGHANERRLHDRVAGLVREGDLCLCDRNFATAPFLAGVAAGGAAFLVRRHGGSKLRNCTPRTAAGRCRTGAVYEQAAELSCGLRCRAITVVRDRPMKGGGREVVLLSNLPAQAATAAALAELYLDRWMIEEAFRQLTQYLSCEVRTLGYPKAALLAFSLAAMAYNCLACVRGAPAAAHGTEKADAELSAYHMAEEVQATHRGMAVAVPPEEWAPFASMTAAPLAEALRGIAAGIRWDRYTKAPRGPKKPAAKRKVARGSHVATAKLLAERMDGKKQARSP